MNSKITATIKTTVATINAFDTTTDTIKTITTVVNNAKQERDAIAYCDSKGLIFCEITAITTGKECKYSVDSDWFLANAERVEKRPNGNYISRTVNINKITALVYNRYTHTAEESVFYTDTKNPTKAMKDIEKQCKGTDKKILKIINSEITPVLYIMSVDKFINNATIEE